MLTHRFNNMKWDLDLKARDGTIWYLDTAANIFGIIKCFNLVPTAKCSSAKRINGAPPS